VSSIGIQTHEFSLLFLSPEGNNTSCKGLFLRLIKDDHDSNKEDTDEMKAYNKQDKLVEEEK